MHIEVVFDNALWPRILEDLGQWETPKNIIKFNSKLLQQPGSSVQHQRGTLPKDCGKRMPSGLQTVAHVMEILFNDLGDLEEEDVEITTYADDIAAEHTSTSGRKSQYECIQVEGGVPKNMETGPEGNAYIQRGLKNIRVEWSGDMGRTAY